MLYIYFRSKTGPESWDFMQFSLWRLELRRQSAAATAHSKTFRDIRVSKQKRGWNCFQPRI
jgi:hypothetical protein